MNLQPEVSFTITEYIFATTPINLPTSPTIGTGRAYSGRWLGKGLENPRFEFRKNKGIYLCSKTPSLAVRSTWLLLNCSRGVKRPEHEADLLSPQATDDNIIRSMGFACWIIKVTDTHLVYVILVAFPRQKWLRDRLNIMFIRTCLLV